MSTTSENHKPNDPLLQKNGDLKAEVCLKEFTEEEINLHNTAQDCWLIIGPQGERKVYDCTLFLDDHPGGPETILEMAGKDANEEFEDIGHSSDARQQLQEFLIGKVKNDVKVVTSSSSASTTNAIAQSIKRENSTTFIAISIIAAIMAIFMSFGRVE
uniref:Cytochrome b5 putative n=1 Tax=Albugo laibachii Nc14 TaxID=890382 RepID=F0W037_9STRA|nr:cytochrome b5 putative [Albugo laibachii Nc14]|eukprot:CCA14408.1 cytochrome b5 putative [Albugo laibachii Nc14]